MGRKFEKGNPGRPKGAKGKATLKREALLIHVLSSLNKYGAEKFFDEWISNRRKQDSVARELIGLIPKEDSLELKGNVIIRIKSNVKTDIAE